ncbi:MAG TPA: ATP-binding protein [Candidatus Eremiobacteraceae bacterium]|nr:ATP-binding protein [Candidatus Eremiobacteraceae bacterium]
MPRIPATVSVARDRVVRFARRRGFSEERTFDIGLAVGEACANAVMHAAASDSWYCVEARGRGDMITVTVADPGAETLPQLAREPDRIGGLGLFLMRSLMDRVSLDMSPKGTKVTMDCSKDDGPHRYPPITCPTE